MRRTQAAASPVMLGTLELARQCSVLLAAAAAILVLGQSPAAALAQRGGMSGGESRQRRGISYLADREFAKALDEFRAAIQLDPENAAAHDYAGVALAELGRPDDAAAEFRRAIQVSDGLSSAHFHLALAYDRMGRALDAIQQYEATLRVDPAFVEAKYALSAACWKLGDRSGAIGRGRCNPTVDGEPAIRRSIVGDESAAVHLRVTRRIPQLGREVAVPLDSGFGELDVAPGCRQSG